MNGERDAVELKLPVWHPSPVRSERIAGGDATTALKIPVGLPANAIAGSAELVISVDRDGLSGIDKRSARPHSLSVRMPRADHVAV